MKALFPDYQSPLDRERQRERKRAARFWRDCRNAQRAPRVRSVFYWSLVGVLWFYAFAMVIR